jgi:hypothetical protein
VIGGFIELAARKSMCNTNYNSEPAKLYPSVGKNIYNIKNIFLLTAND